MDAVRAPAERDLGKRIMLLNRDAFKVILESPGRFLNFTPEHIVLPASDLMALAMR
jgi:hypothetical protein